MGRQHPEPPDYSRLEPPGDPLQSSLLMQDELKPEMDPSAETILPPASPLSASPAPEENARLADQPMQSPVASEISPLRSVPSSAIEREATAAIPTREEKRSRIADAINRQKESEKPKKEVRPVREKKVTRKKESVRKPLAMKNTAPAEKESVGVTEKPESTTFRNTAKGKDPAYHALQIGSYYSEKAASSMTETLRKQGFHPYVEQSNGKYNVRLGRSSSRDGVNQLEKNLRAKFYDPVHVKIP